MNPVKVRNIEIGTGIPKICVPIVGVTKEAILDAARIIKTTAADVVECVWTGMRIFSTSKRQRKP